MDLHLCCCRLQLGPHAKSGDASDVGQGQSGAPGSKENLWLPADAAKSLLPFLPSQNRDAWRESKSSCPFFRSLLERVAERKSTLGVSIHLEISSLST